MVSATSYRNTGKSWMVSATSYRNTGKSWIRVARFGESSSLTVAFSADAIE